MHQQGTVGGGWPTVKCPVLTTIPGTKQPAQGHGGNSTEDSDSWPFINSTQVCPLHYLQSICFHSSYICHPFCSLQVWLFFPEGPQNSDQEYHQFHYNQIVCSSVSHIIGDILSITYISYLLTHDLVYEKL